MTDPNEANPLAQFIVSAPLYSRRQLDIAIETFESDSPPRTSSISIANPKSLLRYCDGQMCGRVMTFDRIATDYNKDWLSDGTAHRLWFNCRHCRAGFAVWISWRAVSGKVSMEKWGEFPRPNIAVPRELIKALDKYADFWRRGTSLRHYGAGIGALAYFRRIVEGSTADLLELLAKAMEIAGDSPEDITAIRRMIHERTRYEEKIEQASRVLPIRHPPGRKSPEDDVRGCERRIARANG